LVVDDYHPNLGALAILTVTRPSSALVAACPWAQ
jgi:hypothetical protein